MNGSGGGKEKENAGTGAGAGKKANGTKVHVVVPEPVLVVEALSPVTPGLDSSLDPVAKKVRNLNKKVRAFAASAVYS